MVSMMSHGHDAAIPSLRPTSTREWQRRREQGFDVGSGSTPLPKYSPLCDVHLRSLFASPRAQRHLRTAGFVDESGNIVDGELKDRRHFVIEREIEQADKVEASRRQEKERRLQDRQLLGQREDQVARHLRQVQAERDRKSVHRRPQAINVGDVHGKALASLAARDNRGTRPRLTARASVDSVC